MSTDRASSTFAASAPEAAALLPAEVTAALAGRRVLVTGAGGFIGSRVAEVLVACGSQVRGFVRYGSTGSAGWLDESPVRDEIDVIAGDIRDARRVDEAVAGTDIVLHLAALIGIPYSYVAPSSYVDVNITGTLNVLEAVRRHQPHRLVVTSTSETYGTARYVPIDEAHPLQPQSPYSASKIGADGLALSYHMSFETPVVVLRPFNTYGPRQSERAVIPTIVHQLLRGDDVRLGNLTPERDLTYVDDTARGFAHCAVTAGIEGDTINLGVGASISIGDLARRLAQRFGASVEPQRDATRIRPDASEVERLLSDNSRAKARLGWRPLVSLDDGLDRTIEFLRSRPVTADRGYVV